jgi:hypothetical protein
VPEIVSNHRRLRRQGSRQKKKRNSHARSVNHSAQIATPTGRRGVGQSFGLKKSVELV